MLEPSTLKFRMLVWMTINTIKASTTASSNSLKTRFIGDAYPSSRAPESSPSHKHPPASAQPDASFSDKENYNIWGKEGSVPRLSPQRSFCYNWRQFSRG